MAKIIEFGKPPDKNESYWRSLAESVNQKHLLIIGFLSSAIDKTEMYSKKISDLEASRSSNNVSINIQKEIREAQEQYKEWLSDFVWKYQLSERSVMSLADFLKRQAEYQLQSSGEERFLQISEKYFRIVEEYSPEDGDKPGSLLTKLKNLKTQLEDIFIEMEQFFSTKI